jgi:hypothetical protein
MVLRNRHQIVHHTLSGIKKFARKIVMGAGEEAAAFLTAAVH